MVKVEMSLSEDKKSLVFKVKGHAGQAEPGKDIVCAVVSGYTHQLGQIALNMYKAGKLAKKPTHSLAPGDATIVVKPKKDYYGEAVIRFDDVAVGFCLLAHNYPQYVQFKVIDTTYESVNI